MELFATANCERRADYLIETIYEAARENDPLWLPLTQEWERRTAPTFGNDVFGKRTVEFYRLRTMGDQISECFTVFQRRFVKNLTLNSFPLEFALGLSKVFEEMTDNVVQHSGPNDHDFSGLAGFHVGPNYMSFVVTDIGRGALARLRDSRTPRDLASRMAARRRPDDGYLRETFTLPRDKARIRARDFLNRYPKAAYMSSVESWRELPGGDIEFTMRRLTSAG